MWNYQILLLVHGQVNGQNPLAQPRFTCPKIDVFFFVFFSYFSKKTYVVGTHQKRLTVCCGYSSEAPHRGASDEYPQHMFSSRNKKNIYLIRGHPRSFYILYIFTSPSSQDREVSQLRDFFSKSPSRMTPVL